jgi:two-component system response regulator FixJ
MTPEPVIHVVEDDQAVRQSLTFLLSASGYAVRTYDCADAFLAAQSRVQPGCLLTDIRMPGTDGLTLLRYLKLEKTSLAVIVMTGHGDVAQAVEAMKAGAVDFIEKPFSDETLLEAIRLAVGRHEMDARRHEEKGSIENKLAALSPREREVLEGLAAGLPNKTIAYDLKISARTVEVHRANVMTKLGARSLADLVRMIFAVNASKSG